MRIYKIELQTAKLPELKRFYTGTLGLHLAEEAADAFALQVGQSVLRFAEAAKGTEPYYHFALNIPENQIAEAQVWLQERVALLEVEGKPVADFPNWNAHSLYFYDPAGNIVELIARHKLPNASSTAFGPGSLLSISEIGLPVEEAPAVAERVHRELGLAYFNNSKFDNFNALGDDEGLLLVVSQQRHWYPTEVDSRNFPVRVEIAGSKSLSLPEYGYEMAGTG